MSHWWIFAVWANLSIPKPTSLRRLLRFAFLNLDSWIWNWVSWITDFPCFRSTLANQLLEKLTSTIPISWKIAVTKATFQEVGLGTWKSYQESLSEYLAQQHVLLFDERHLLDHGFVNYAMRQFYQDVAPIIYNSAVLSIVHTFVWSFQMLDTWTLWIAFGDLTISSSIWPFDLILTIRPIFVKLGDLCPITVAHVDVTGNHTSVYLLHRFSQKKITQSTTHDVVSSRNNSYHVTYLLPFAVERLGTVVTQLIGLVSRRLHARRTHVTVPPWKK